MTKSGYDRNLHAFAEHAMGMKLPDPDFTFSREYLDNLHKEGRLKAFAMDLINPHFSIDAPVRRKKKAWPWSYPAQAAVKYKTAYPVPMDYIGGMKRASPAFAELLRFTDQDMKNIFPCRLDMEEYGPLLEKFGQEISSNDTEGLSEYNSLQAGAHGNEGSANAYISPEDAGEIIVKCYRQLRNAYALKKDILIEL